MRRRERASKLKFRLLQALVRRRYRDIDESVREMTGADPFAASRARLGKLLSFAAGHNEHYAGLLAKSRELERLPILTKDVIRRKFAALQSTGPTAARYENTSGGSTGRPVVLIQDAAYALQAEATHEYYFREFLGVERYAVRNAWLWGSDRDLAAVKPWRKRIGCYLQNRLLLDTFEMTNDRRWLEHVERLRSWRPHYVAGYAGSLHQMARAARKHGVRLPRPRFLHSAAEMLRDFMREEIEERFGAKAYDYYGSREVGAIAGECRAGRRHVFIMNNVVEIVDDAGRPAGDGEEGRIIVTNLHNYSMPLIRYDVGDTGAMRFDPCGCGSPLPVLEKLTGRVTDHFRSRDGGVVHGEFFTHLFYFRSWIEQFQVDQVDYDHLRVSVVRRAGIDEDGVAEVEAGIRGAMGRGCRVEWRYVDRIPKTAQGKHRFTRCLLDE